MTQTTYRAALRLALTHALEADDSVFMLGEDIAAAGGVFKVTEGLLDRFGARRVMNTPISEQAIVGAAIGAAARGLRPIAEVMFADFCGVCYDQIANQLAKYRYMTGGQVTMPVTIRMANGAGAGFASQHSQTVENWFLNVPGLKIVAPSSPADAYSLLRLAVEDDDPVLVLEHKAMLAVKGDLPEERSCTRLGEAATVREGRDVTVVATQLVLTHAASAAGVLAQEGISVEVIDPRTVAPLDVATVAKSVVKTGRLVVAQESPAAGSWGATLVASVASSAFESLAAPPVLISSDHTPVPFAGSLENAWIPSAERIADAIRGLA
jgi:pyruvate dehydrogenase E1 component beta subunit